MRWEKADQASWRKHDPGKVQFAPRRRRETTLTIKAIAARVQLGTYHTANARLHQAMKEGFAASDSAPATIGKLMQNANIYGLTPSMDSVLAAIEMTGGNTEATAIAWGTIDLMGQVFSEHVTDQ